MTARPHYEPVIIIGAGRSGTNMLRDVLTQLPGFGTWPCDEINYIWRHGNVRHPDDELSPAHATPRVRRYIQDAFGRIAVRQGLTHVVEKTCANSLRVAFVDAVLSGARFIRIVRDGRDVVVSSRARWTARLDLPYIARKARYVPLTDLPYYGSRYLWNRLYRFMSADARLASWGPRMAGLPEALSRYSLDEVCALQWQRCVERAERDLSLLPAPRVHRLRYEDFVARPAAELDRIVEFLGVPPPADARAILRQVSGTSVGQWRRKIDEPRRRSIESLIGDSLRAHGYA
jgi:hypothetical protein